MASEEPPGAAAPPPAGAPPAAPERKPLFDLQKVLEQRAASGQGSDMVILAWMDMQDRREDREWRRMQANNPATAAIEERVRKLEKQSEMEAVVAPLKNQIKELSDKLDKFTEKPPAASVEPDKIKDLKDALDGLDKRLDAIDQRYQTTNEIQSIKTELTNLKTAIEQGGAGKAPVEAVDAIDQATKLIDKITELTKKSWVTGEGEVDWRTTAITTTGEIATEAIKAAREIMSGAPEEETEEEKKKKAAEKTEKISEYIIDKKVLGYLGQRLATGAKEFNTAEAGKELGLTPDQVLDSYQRLKDKGLITSVTKEGKGVGEKVGEETASFVEGA